MLRGAAFLGLMAILLPTALVRPFVGVLLWCWISFMNPHRQLWPPFSDWPWAAIVFGFAALGFVFAPRAGRVAPTTTTWLFIALMGCFTMTSMTALGPPELVWAKWELIFKIILGLLLTASLLSDRERVHALIWVIVLAMGYYGVKGGFFTILHGGTYRVWGPPDSIITDNNHLAVALLVSVPLMNYLRLQSPHRYVRWVLIASMLLTVLAALGSHSRGAFLALAAGTLAFWFRSRRRLLMAVALVGCLAGGIAFMPDSWSERMATIDNYEEDASATDRLLLWRVSFQLALSRPLVGTGFYGPYIREVVDLVDPQAPARAVHSTWFELLGEQGFPTSFLWLGILLLGVWHAWRLPRLTRTRPDLGWAGDLGQMAQISLLVFMVGGTFLSLSYWDALWTLIVILGATHALVTRAVRADQSLPSASARQSRRHAPITPSPIPETSGPPATARI